MMNDLSSFQDKPFNTTIIQVYAPTTDAREAEVDHFYEDLEDLLELTPKKYVLFIIRDWNAKLGSFAAIGMQNWSDRQVWPWRTKWSRAKTNWILQRECISHSKYFFSNTRDDFTHGHHEMVNTKIKLITFFVAKDGEAVYSQQKTRPGANCGSDHQLLIANFRLKLKKTGKNTRPTKD